MSAVQDIDDRIAELYEEIRQLRTKRNLISPLLRLPSEILVHIMILLQGVVGQPNSFLSTFSWHTFDSNWVNITQACSHTRQIALETQNLWVMFDLTQKRRRSKSWLELTSERAGNAGLTIVVSRDIQEPLAIPYVARAKSLRVFPATESKDGMLARALNKPIPLIENLDLLYENLPVRKTFLGGTSHTLRSLFLIGARIESAPDLPNLRVMQLHRVFADPGLNTLCKFLERCPRVEHLTINNICLDQSIQYGDGHVVIDTKSLVLELVMLQIDNPAEQNWTLLSTLRSPKRELRIIGPMFSSRSRYIMTTPITGYYERIVDHLQSWWKQVSGQDVLGVGRIDSSWILQEYRHDVLTLTGRGVECAFSFETMVKVVGTAPSIWPQVHTLEMNLAGKPFERVFGNGDQSRMQVEWLSGLRHVIIHGFDLQPSETHDLISFASVRALTGMPLESIEFTSCKNPIWRVARHLAESQHVGTVTWEATPLLQTIDYDISDLYGEDANA